MSITNETSILLVIFEVITSLVWVYFLVFWPKSAIKQKKWQIFVVKNAWLLKPNRLCDIRLAGGLIMAPAMYYSLYHINEFLHFSVTFIYVILFSTDALDGITARGIKGWESNYGKWYDPLADKFCDLPAMVIIAAFLNDSVTWNFVVLIIIADILGQSFRSGTKTGATWVGKTKTVFKIVTLVYCYVTIPTGWSSLYVIYGLLLISAILAVWSGSQKITFNTLRNFKQCFLGKNYGIMLERFGIFL